MPRFCRQGSSISSYYVCCQWQCHTKSRVESVQRKFTTYHYSCYITRSFWIFLLWVCCGLVYSLHSNDSHQCSILAADLLWNRKWTAYLYPSLTSCPCLDGLFIFYPITKNNKVSCKWDTDSNHCCVFYLLLNDSKSWFAYFVYSWKKHSIITITTFLIQNNTVLCRNQLQ